VNMEAPGPAGVDWPMVEELLRESWRMTAPKKLRHLS
jgi:hypothetical protein